MGYCARTGRLKTPQQGRVWGTVLRAQSICSANPACFRQQQQQQLQWYAVSMHPHKGTVGLRPVPPCMRASELGTSDGARTSQRQQQQQQQQRLVRRIVISPPYDLTGTQTTHSSLLKNINEPRSLRSGRTSTHMLQGSLVPARGERQNHTMVCGCHLLSLDPHTGRPRSHLLVDVLASQHPSLLKNHPHHTYAGEKAARIRNTGYGATNNEGRTHI